MFRGFSLSIVVILLLSCAGFGAVGQAHGHTLAGPGSAAVPWLAFGTRDGSSAVTTA